MTKEAYISVDVETAGPIPGTYSLLSIGACVVGQVSESFYVELQPITQSFIPEAMKIVGKPLEDFSRTGHTPEEAMKLFRDWIISKDPSPVFVGFNATFDWSFVNWYFHTYLGDNPFGIGGIDIKSYYMGLAGCAWEDTRSSRIPAEFKGNSRHTHNALDDAVEQAEMFELMIKALREGK